MRVAIIGAGISGLSCAIGLKRNGIIPTIFEKTGDIGDDPGYLIASFRLFNNSLRSPMKYLKKNYDINLTAIHSLDEIIMISLNKKISAKGSLGYIFKKSSEKDSLENQLASIADTPVNFDTNINLKDLKNNFDHIIVATGSHTIADELNTWKLTFQAHIRTAKIVGDFKPGLIKIWLNKDYSNNGYGYLITEDHKRAELALVVSDITHHELDYYWQEFLLGEKIEYSILHTNDIEHHVGYAQPAHMGNIYFIGNAGGMVDNFLGFGTIRSIESGFIAARSIIKNLDYRSLLQPLIKDVNAMYEYRKMINNLDNNDYDTLLSFIGLPVVKQLLYNNPLYKAKHGVLFPKLINTLKKK